MTVPVIDRETRLLLRNFSQTITFTTDIPETHLLINLFFIRTESRSVEVNLTVGENELTSFPLLRRNGIVNDYVLTQRSSGQVLWLKFDVKGSLLISVNVLKEGAFILLFTIYKIIFNDYKILSLEVYSYAY